MYKCTFLQLCYLSLNDFFQIKTIRIIPEKMVGMFCLIFSVMTVPLSLLNFISNSLFSPYFHVCCFVFAIDVQFYIIFFIYMCMEEGLSVGFVRLVRWRFVCHVHIARVHVCISINITFLYQMFLIGSHGKQV